MPERSEPLRENEVGAFGELAQRPNPDNFIILPVPAVEHLLASLQNNLGRELTPEEVERHRRKAISIVVTRESAQKIQAERQARGEVKPVQTDGRLLPPTVQSAYDAMPSDVADRNEAAVEILGQHLFSLRNQVVEGLRRTIESAESRERLGSLHRKEYDAVAALSTPDREAAMGLARKAIDLYLQHILVLFTGTGDSLCFGPRHAINYRLVLEVKDVESDNVIEELCVNRDCKKVFYDYYGRWLNRYNQHR